MFTTLGTLAVGAKIKDTSTSYYGVPIIWQIADKNHSGYPANSVTLITEKILTLKCFDGKEPSNSDTNRRNDGNNRYIYANMRRWLNSAAGAGAWYAAQHSTDAPPNSANVSTNPYDTQAGFLNTFSSNFLNALLTTTLTVARNTVTDGGSYETLTDKLFLASNTEVGLANENSIVEGAKLALFTDNGRRVATPTAECVGNGGNGTVGSGWHWWLRTPYASSSYYARYVYASGTLGYIIACNGNYGVRPLCNLLSSILVSDTTDSDGCYRILWKIPPNPPATINVPTTIYSGQTTTVGWSAVADPDGDSVSYRLERGMNGGGWLQVYSGAGLSFSEIVPVGLASVAYRVKAYDIYGVESDYITSSTRIIPTSTYFTQDSDKTQLMPHTLASVVRTADGATVDEALVAYNPVAEITTSQSFTITQDGRYLIVLVGGGGAVGDFGSYVVYAHSGLLLPHLAKLTIGTILDFEIGAGGIAGKSMNPVVAGNTILRYGTEVTITAYGGKGGTSATQSSSENAFQISNQDPISGLRPLPATPLHRSQYLPEYWGNGKYSSISGAGAGILGDGINNLDALVGGLGGGSAVTRNDFKIAIGGGGCAIIYRVGAII